MIHAAILALAVLAPPQRVVVEASDATYVVAHVQVSSDTLWVTVVALGTRNTWNADPDRGYCTQRATLKDCMLPLCMRSTLSPWQAGFISSTASTCQPGVRVQACATSMSVEEVHVSCVSGDGLSGCPCDVFATTMAPNGVCVYP